MFLRRYTIKGKGNVYSVKEGWNKWIKKGHKRNVDNKYGRVEIFISYKSLYWKDKTRGKKEEDGTSEKV